MYLLLVEIGKYAIGARTKILTVAEAYHEEQEPDSSQISFNMGGILCNLECLAVLDRLGVSHPDDIIAGRRCDADCCFETPAWGTPQLLRVTDQFSHRFSKAMLSWLHAQIERCNFHPLLLPRMWTLQ